MLIPSGKWLALGLGLSLLLSFLCLPGGPLYGLDLRAGDMLLRLRPSRPVPPEIVVVAVDDKSIRRLGRWPWPRTRHAELIRRLKAAGARVIAFDVLFSEPSEADGDLAKATAQAGCVVYAAQVTEQPPSTSAAGAASRVEIQPGIVIHRDRLPRARAVVPPQPLLANSAAAVGVAVLRPDPDGTVRRAILLVGEEASGRLYPTFPLAVAKQAAGLEAARMRFDLSGEARLPPGAPVPLDDNGNATVGFSAGGTPAVSYSFVDVLTGSVRPEAFRQKIVLVGFTAAGLHDVYPTAVSGAMCGVEINAAIVSDLLHGAFLRTADRPTAIAFTVLLGMLAAGVAGRLRPLQGAALVAAVAALFLWGALRLLTSALYALPITAPLLALAGGYSAVAVSRLAAEEAGRRRLREEFSRYAPPAVVSRLDAGLLEQRLAGTVRPVSVLFADIRSFTELTARTEPRETVALLNSYFDAMTRVAFDLEGTVDNIAGDEVMVTFNVLEDQHDHVERVAHLAVNMVRELERLNRQWLVKGELEGPLRIGIGINTGDAVVGNVGSHIRTQYTVVGQVVNLASRLEKLNVELGTTILATGEVIAETGGRFRARSMGKRAVRGHPELVDVYEIVGRAGDETAAEGQTETGNGKVSSDGGGDL